MTTSNVVVGKNDFTVESLYNLYKQQPSKVLFNTEYQRSYIWKIPRKQLLIDSIVRGYDINKIFLRQVSDGGYECLDGQQRLRSIFDFIDSTYALCDFSSDLQLEGKSIADLKEELPQFYYKILYYKIDAIVVYQADDETTSDIFLRLQEGIPLNSAEKLNAMRGVFRNKVVQLAKHPFWKSLAVDTYRFSHRHLCAQTLSIELSNINLPNSGLHVIDVKFPTLRRNYELYKSVDIPQTVLDAFNDTLNFLHKALGKEGGIIKQKGDIVPLYLLASYLLKKYASVKQKDSEFKNFVEDFLTRVYNSSQPPYSEYRNARSKSTESRKSIQSGLDIMLGKFLEFAPNLELKDPQRNFDYGQRLAIYFRDNSKCQEVGCGKALSFNEVEYHHKKAWHAGGLTTVANGLLLCQQCHAKQPKYTATP